jgi:uncharacterized protein
MRVVIDTNVLVSGLMFRNGNEARILGLLEAGSFIACVTLEILVEYEKVLARPKLRIDAYTRAGIMNQFRVNAILFTPVHRLTISPDDSDNRFIECAEAASVDFLITGNKRLFPASHGKTKIVNAREFLDAMQLR